MNIGGKPYYLDIDTGSNLTWLECQHQDHRCKISQGPHPPYKPNTSLKKVNCQDGFCAQVHKDLPAYPHPGPRCDASHPHECHYSVRYVGGTSSDGFIVIDTVLVDVVSPPKREKVYLGFGCGCNQKPLKASPVDGLLGLGMGQVGFVAQLKAQNVISKDIIGHCLSVNGGGYLFVGEHNVPTGITWAPMTKYSNYYTPGLAQLLFEKKEISNKMVVFDSGATYTYIPEPAYKKLYTEVENSVRKSLQPVHDSAHPVCWKGPFQSINEVKGKFKSLSLKFPNNVAMQIPPENYLVLTVRKNACLGILNGKNEGVGDMILIGDVTMQDLLVIYDNEAKRIGWVTQKCPTPKMTSIRRVL